MFENLADMGPEELADILRKRVNFNNPQTPIRIEGRRVVAPLVLEKMVISNPNTPFAGITFENCVFENEVRIGEFLAAGRVHISNCKFKDNVFWQSIDNTTYSGTIICEKDLEVSLGSQKELKNLTVCGDLSISATTKRIDVQGISSGESLEEQVMLIRGNFISLRILDVDFYEIKISSMFISDLSLEKVNMATIMVDNWYPAIVRMQRCRLGELLFSQLVREKAQVKILETYVDMLFLDGGRWGKVELDDCIFDLLHLSEILEKDAFLAVTKSNLNKLAFDGFYNNGVVSFGSVTLAEKGELQMTNSTLGKTDFILCSFQNGRFIFQNSKLTELFLAETNFPIDFVDDKNYTQSQLAFGQISVAYQKQGDTVRYLEYQAREIESHYRRLEWFDGKGLRAGWRRFSFTKLSLWLNRWSNDFGRNWGRGLLFSFGVGLVMYYFLIISSKQFHIGWPTIDWQLVSAFFRFMNPLRFFESENLFRLNGGTPYLTLTPGSYVIDFLARILVAYGYYQVIQAFRRYGRKS